MRNESTGLSKEFGFVSFETPIEAHNAMVGMDGQKLFGEDGAGKNCVVRLHEPKRFREGRLKMRFSETGGIGVGEEGLASLSLVDSPDRSPQGSVYDPSRSISGDFPAAFVAPESPSPASTPLSEEERLLAAVRKIDEERAGEIVGLLMGLPKKERAMCLFNPDHLKLKITDALIILTPDSDTEEGPQDDAPATPPKLSSSSSQSQVSSLPTPATTPKTLPLPSIPSSFSALSRLPAKEFVALIQSSDLTSLGVERVSEEVEMKTNGFMDGLEGFPVAERKQKLGDRVFRAIKKAGVKG
ncbi:hypothetical protein P7C70_g9266, partial [Phenoliferia sp. Uapishka_3]